MHEELTPDSYEPKPNKVKSHRANYTLTLKLKSGIERKIGIIADGILEAGQVAGYYAIMYDAKVCIQQGFKVPNINTN